MGIYYATSLLTAATCITLGGFVIYKNPKNPLHRSLLRLNVMVAAWSFFLFLHYSSVAEHSALFTLKLLHAAAVFIPSCYLHFVLNLLEIDRKKMLRISYLLSMVFLILNFSPNFISGVGPRLNFRYYATAGNLYFLWIIAYSIISGYGICMMLKNYPSCSPQKKNQIKYILLASFIGFAGGATIFPLFYNMPIPPAGEHFIFLYPIIFALAVLKHNLLDINIVIKHTLVYSVSVILITLAYLVVVMLAERLLQNIVGYQSLWVTLIAAVAIALLFSPVKNRVQAMVEKIHAGGEYQRFKKELLEANKRKAVADLAVGMAHEIRNPLSAIKTFAEYMPLKFNDARFRENFSRIVTGEVDKISSLIGQILEFAKPSLIKTKDIDVHKVLDYTLELFSSEMIRYNIKASKDYSPDSPAVNADPNKLKQVFINIIKNSIETMSGGGTLNIRTERKDRFYIEIGDTGPGIRKKDIGSIFEPFFSKKENGTGLGLAVVQSIITEHGGNITVKSAPGMGTTFRICL